MEEWIKPAMATLWRLDSLRAECNTTRWPQQLHRKRSSKVWQALWPLCFLHCFSRHILRDISQRRCPGREREREREREQESELSLADKWPCQSMLMTISHFDQITHTQSARYTEKESEKRCTERHRRRR